MSREVKVGDTVCVESSGLTGVVKFKGPTKFAKGQWVGVALNAPEGKHDGTVKGVNYFKAQPMCGLFVRPEGCVKIKPSLVRSKSGKNVRSKIISQRFDKDGGVDTKGMVLNTINKDMLAAALDYENFQFLRILVEEDHVPVSGVDNSGNTVLHQVAAKKSGVKVLTYLLERGLIKNMHDENIYGETAVILAARNHCWHNMKYLIEQGADVISVGSSQNKSVWDYCRNLEGHSIMHKALVVQAKARANEELGVEKMRHKKSLLAQTLFKTAMAGDLKFVRMLLEQRDTNVNACDSAGNNVLHWISSDSKRLNIVKYIVAMGGRIHVKNDVGDTPCLVAARSRAWNVMQYLVSIGASVSTKDEKNNKSVFKYAQVNLTARKALKEGLQERKAKGLSEIVPDAIYEPTQADMEETIRIQEEDEKMMEEEELEATRGWGDESLAEMARNSKDTAEEETTDAEHKNDGDLSFKNKEEILEDIKNSGEPEVLASAGTFSGIVTGKKKDKTKHKLCKVNVSQDAITISYKKGAWYSRTQKVDVYKWSDQMGLKKVDDRTLEIVLDPLRPVSLAINPCQPDSLEEFIWKNIWRSVFEVSVRDAKELLNDYERYCNDTTDKLENTKSMMEKLLIAKRNAMSIDDDVKVEKITDKLEAVSGQLYGLLERFDSIKTQGQTLIATFDKMYEALERRYDAEQARLAEFQGAAKDDKVNIVQMEMDAIEKQMTRVGADKEIVTALYHRMREAEMEYASYTKDESF